MRELVKAKIQMMEHEQKAYAFKDMTYNDYGTSMPRTARVNKDDFMFAMLCFLILMENGKGLIDKAPNYVLEKGQMMQCTAMEAYSMLDRGNQEKLMAYCEAWDYQLPKSVFDYEAALIRDSA